MTNKELKERIEELEVSANSLYIISNISPTITLNDFRVVLKEHLEKCEKLKKDFNESIGEDEDA